MTCMYKGNKYRLVRNFTTNVTSIYGLENQFPNNKFMDNTIQFVHKTWGGVWVVIAISGILFLKCSVALEKYQDHNLLEVGNKTSKFFTATILCK